MGAGYQVIYGDLGDLAGAFTAESSLFASLNAGISGAMGEHGTKLRECHDDYHENDSDVVALYNKVIEEA
jgi:hypothetical protein